MINDYCFVDPDKRIGVGDRGCYICFSDVLEVGVQKSRNRYVFNRQSAALNKLYSNNLTRNVCNKEFGSGFFINNDAILLLEKSYCYITAENIGYLHNKTPNALTSVVHTSFLSKTYEESLKLCRILLHIYGVLNYPSLLDAIFR